jgi:hypothetical protein
MILYERPKGANTMNGFNKNSKLDRALVQYNLTMETNRLTQLKSLYDMAIANNLMVSDITKKIRETMALIDGYKGFLAD